jgi:hypothetical protein
MALARLFPIAADTANFLAVASSIPHHLTNMDRFASSAGDRPDKSGNARFTSQAATAEDLLKAQTVGLVNLDDYRKRRAEALDRKERGDTAVSSGENTPADGYGDVSNVVGCSLICKVQGINAEARLQEEAQDSW